jgi:hypothetical protein
MEKEMSVPLGSGAVLAYRRMRRPGGTLRK